MVLRLKGATVTHNFTEKNARLICQRILYFFLQNVRIKSYNNMLLFRLENVATF